ncbi:MAG: hypothetical protein JWP03_4823 [Phycisphaerales bacterium]|jgi:hypothetical protein|nr:hypothetical protein [Phycisphaerales bacterium]
MEAFAYVLFAAIALVFGFIGFVMGLIVGRRSPKADRRGFSLD